MTARFTGSQLVGVGWTAWVVLALLMLPVLDGPVYGGPVVVSTKALPSCPRRPRLPVRCVGRRPADIAWGGRCAMGDRNAGAAAGGGAIYGLGIFGAWVYFWQQADGFWEFVWAVVQGIFWPAFMVYEAFAALGG
jgi:hypothetical protein